MGDGSKPAPCFSFFWEHQKTRACPSPSERQVWRDTGRNMQNLFRSGSERSHCHFCACSSGQRQVEWSECTSVGWRNILMAGTTKPHFKGHACRDQRRSGRSNVTLPKPSTWNLPASLHLAGGAMHFFLLRDLLLTPGIRLCPCVLLSTPCFCHGDAEALITNSFKYRSGHRFLPVTGY